MGWSVSAAPFGPRRCEPLSGQTDCPVGTLARTRSSCRRRPYSAVERRPYLGGCPPALPAVRRAPLVIAAPQAAASARRHDTVPTIRRKYDSSSRTNPFTWRLGCAAVNVSRNLLTVGGIGPRLLRRHLRKHFVK